MRQFSIPKLLYDSAQVNSRGDIYLISKNGRNLIDYFDKFYNLKKSILDIKSHFEYPFYKKPKDHIKYVSDLTLKKVITKNDHLIVFSNNSQTVFHLNENNKLIHKFKIEHEFFIKDFKKRLRKAVSKGNFIAPFELSLDSNELLCCLYYNSSYHKNEIYRYKLSGEFIDVLRFPDKTGGIFCFNSKDLIFITSLEKNLIEIYKI